MKIFDLHNDALTGGGKADADVIYAIWSTKLKLSEVLALYAGNKDKMLSLEDCGVFKDNFDLLVGLDFKYCGLTWNGFNGLAGGAESDGRLTGEGKRLIARLNEKGTPVDTAHLNEASFYDAAELADKIICSHTCFYERNKHPRNLTREQISVIIEKGGIVGLCFVTDFLGGDGIDDVISHIDWFLSAFGDKNLAVGTDFFGTNHLPKGLTSYKNFDKLTLAMIRLGYSDRTIHGILYGNAASYFKDRG